MSTSTPIAPSGFSFENSIAVDPTDAGYGAARTFTLADSFYDAHANDVLLPRKKEDVSVEPVASKPEKSPYTFDPAISTENLESEADSLAGMPSLWPEETQDKNRPPAYFVAPPVAEQPQSALVSTPRASQNKTRRHVSPEARMEDSFRIPVVATIVFVITMIAIFYMGSQVAGYYAPVVQGDRVEFVGRPNQSL